MKAISLLQPWASLVAIGAKRNETRSWTAQYRGPIAIHASQKMAPNERAICLHPRFRVALRHAGIEGPFQLPRGCVIAKATLVDCIRITDTPAARAGIAIPPDPNSDEFLFGNYTSGRYAWILSDVHKLEHPITAKGSLGLWDWEEPK